MNTGQGANWNFNLPMGGAPGLHGHQQRNLGQMGSFAQSVGGSQLATPLDLSYVLPVAIGRQHNASENRTVC